MRKDMFFRVDASLMQQLGASLISDDLSCLVELIKNSYDADAVSVSIVIDAPDKIVVSDDGHGMDASTIRLGWLTISNSLKIQQKRQGILTAKQKRTPLGDKGLGRLSTQRLGNHLRIETVPENGKKCYVVDIDWPTFTPGADLTSIPVGFEELPRGNRKSGTKLTISDLINPQEWETLGKETLRLSLASLVSPYEGVASFRLTAFLNGSEVSPSPLTSNVRKAAVQRFAFQFDGSSLVANGSVRPSTFRGTTVKAREDYSAYFEADGGKGFLEYLLSDVKAKAYSLAKADSDGYFVDFSVERSFVDILGKNQYVSPGPFAGEVDSFSLDSVASAEVREGADALNTSAEARQLIKDLSGIRVYRDGFSVRTAHDWLKLGEAQTSGGSYYGLRPFNTMGYVAISAALNVSLRETTDREGFIEDTTYRGFYAVLQSFIKTVNDALEFLRRAWTLYVKDVESKRYGVPSRDPRVIRDRLDTSFRQVGEVRGLLGRASKTISEALEKDAESLFGEGSGAARDMSGVQDLIGQASQALEEVSASGGLTGLLVAELDALNARLGEVYELVSLGITAEALSHDISNALERLSVETNSVQRHARSSNLDDLKVIRFFEVVRSTVSALEKQLGHLDPALKYAREKREEFLVSTVISEAQTYYELRFEKSSITLNILVKEDFSVRMNKGKLIQVLDNLILNSEYWVKLASKRAPEGSSVTITVDKPQVIVEDSGLGVEFAYEETLFDPFITAKPKGEGRGLGLFIATQLLDLDGCSLRLLPERNQHGRRFRLAIGLQGVLEGG